MKEYIEREAALEIAAERIPMSLCVSVSEYDAMNRARGIIYKLLRQIPTVDAVSVVRCKDCKYYQKAKIDIITPHDMVCAYATRHRFYRELDDYCSKGERKGGDET